MASNANGRVSGVQHSGAAAPYEGGLGYVFKKSRLEVCEGAGKAVQIHEAARVHWNWSIHKELRDSQCIVTGSELAEEVNV